MIEWQLHYGARTVIGFLTSDYKHKYEEYSQQLSQYYENNALKIKVDFGEDIGEGLEAIYKGIKVSFLGLILIQIKITTCSFQYLHSGSNIGKVLVKL